MKVSWTNLKMPLGTDLFPRQRLKTQVLSYDECNFISDLLKEGVPLGRCLILLKNSRNSKVIDSILGNLESGESISHYFFRNESDLMMFDFFLSLYSFAEALEHCLLLIKTKNRIFMNFVSKLIYPFVIVVVSCFCLLFVCFWVMPSVFSMITSMGIESDKFLYYVCIGLAILLSAMLMIVTVLLGVVVSALREKRIVELFNKCDVNNIREAFKFIFTLLFCTYINVLLSQEIPTKKALQLLEGMQDGCTNVIARKCIEDLEMGTSFQASLKSCELIAEEYSTILNLGEVSNQVLKYSENYERISFMRIEKMTKLCIQCVLGISYACVGLCAVVIMQMMMSPLQLFELL